MNSDQSNIRVPAPCIIDTGIVVNKLDMRRLLADLGRVHYIHTQDGKWQSEGEGFVIEVFADPHRSTLVANHALYLNVYSFDYLELKRSGERESYFELVQDNRHLQLIPLSNPLQEQNTSHLNAAALEAVLTEVLSAKLDAEMDDEGTFPF
ncbi:MAG: hypothetical protein KME19_03835 [Microcoleus vaginatus WJT46-NPBG5]|jgi:hypothetical protein|nr:hypothetical protein [Microcoleus vaginatus WJT46-NPBG5]